MEENTLVHYPTDKIVLIVDNQSISKIQREQNFNVDYYELREWFAQTGQLRDASIYFQIVEGQGNNLVRLKDYTAYNGYTPYVKDVKDVESLKFGGLDIPITLGMINASEYADHIFLLSTNSNFVDAIEYVQRRGVPVTVVFALDDRRSTKSLDLLRKAASGFLNILSIKDSIESKFEDSEEDQLQSA